ncbi:UNKNOWN [Stylonychia lemnae]|uniref:J domain-containing protein n=1 Tax=Stylonychia lemnae TaxID=5949 RepID=A0A078AX58_STYLE|nr:UNKNOWN [Stylonychia lemnae]|eukprot:CDW86651.1 UNKNOWN [Stylonychia lemnae]
MQFIGRPENYFEILNLDNTIVTQEKIRLSYEDLNNKFNPANNPDPENLKKFKKIQEAYDCLRITPCRMQYKKFGNYIQNMGGDSASNDPVGSTDWRVGSSLVYYVTFALLAAAMSTVEVRYNIMKFLQQKNGLRYSLALAVVFCLNEIQWMVEVKSENDENYQPRSSTLAIAKLFPPTYCLFEKIYVMQLVYLFIFNLVCTYSKTFGIDEHKKKINIVREIIQNQIIIDQNLREIYKKMKGEEFPNDKTYLRKEIKEYRKQRQNDVKLQMEALIKDKKKEEIEWHKKRNMWAVRLCQGSCFLFFIYKKFMQSS